MNTLNIKYKTMQLKNTWETYDKIEEQYTSIDSRLSNSSKQLIAYLDTLPELNKKVFILYTELASYRKVGEEVGLGKDKVGKIINSIKTDVHKKQISIRYLLFRLFRM